MTGRLQRIAGRAARIRAISILRGYGDKAGLAAGCRRRLSPTSARERCVWVSGVFNAGAPANPGAVSDLDERATGT
jgi:hypothetical protein